MNERRGTQDTPLLRGRAVVGLALGGPVAPEAIRALDQVIPADDAVLAVCRSFTNGGFGLAGVTHRHLHLWDDATTSAASLPWRAVEYFDVESNTIRTVHGDEIRLLSDSDAPLRAPSQVDGPAMVRVENDHLPFG